MPSGDVQEMEYGALSAGEEPMVRFSRKGASWWGGFSTVVKSVVGSGILALPVAFKETGLALGTILIVIFAFVSLYSHRIIIMTIRELRKKGKGPPDGAIEYQELSSLTFGAAGEGISAFAAISTQLGACVSFLVFIGENMADVTGASGSIITLGLVPILIILALIKDASLFAPTSHLGNAALVLAVSTVFWYGFSESPPRSLETYTQFRYLGLPIFFGIGVYTFTAHCEVVSIEQDMNNREEFLSILNWAFLFISTLYLSFGALCYMFFGDDTNEIIFENLGASSFVIFVKICICVCLLVQYPITLLPASVTFEDLLKVRNHVVWSFLVRVFLVMFTVFFAIMIPSFEIVTSFVGAFSNGSQIPQSHSHMPMCFETVIKC
eukprot:jgi/Bigna1/74444/fgenesh1_pg.29_\